MSTTQSPPAQMPFMQGPTTLGMTGGFGLSLPAVNLNTENLAIPGGGLSLTTNLNPETTGLQVPQMSLMTQMGQPFFGGLGQQEGAGSVEMPGMPGSLLAGGIGQGPVLPSQSFVFHANTTPLMPNQAFMFYPEKILEGIDEEEEEALLKPIVSTPISPSRDGPIEPTTGVDLDEEPTSKEATGAIMDVKPKTRDAKAKQGKKKKAKNWLCCSP